MDLNTVQEEFKNRYQLARKVRLDLEQRGNDPDLLYTVLLSLLEELKEIKAIMQSQQKEL